MMKKSTTEGDVNNNSIDKSFEELEEDVARLASDESEARKWLKERVMRRFISRVVYDAKKNIKRQEKQEEGIMKKQKEVVLKVHDATQFHDQKMKKCNNNEEKGVEVKKKPDQMMQEGTELKYFCVPPKKRIRFKEEVELHANNNDNHEKRCKCKCKCNNNNKKKGMKVNKSRFADVGIDPPPDLPDKLKKYIEERGGSDIKLVIMKQLFQADLENHNNRITIPINQLRDDTVLTEEEKEFIKPPKKKKREMEMERKRGCGCVCVCENDNEKYKPRRGGNGNSKLPGLVIKLIEPSMEECEQILKIYDLHSDVYALIGNWNNVVKRNQHVLKIGTIVQFWSFRRQQLSLEEQSSRVFVKNNTPLMLTNLSFVLVILDGKAGKDVDDDGASTSGCGDMKTPSPHSAVTDQGGNY